MSAIQKDLENTTIDDSGNLPRISIRVNNVVGGKFIRKKGVVKTRDTASIDEEGGIATEKKPTAERFEGGGGDKSKVECPRGICIGRDIGDVCGEHHRPARDRGSIVDNKTSVTKAGVLG